MRAPAVSGAIGVNMLVIASAAPPRPMAVLKNDLKRVKKFILLRFLIF
jgi:hypothetical protein